uniref:Uncharacterized protein MANES_03G089500 n=1 Tax=Rhizophora mucronata TaxID=61149 RepID=A0A2P2K2W3_RHIMU
MDGSSVKLEQEKICKCRPYNCPYAGVECSITGDIPSLVIHLKTDHKVDVHNGCTFNHRYVKSNPRAIENATWMLTVRSLCQLRKYMVDMTNSAVIHKV